MGTFHNPKIITDRMEFYYDMDNVKKSWRGKPTTNLQEPDVTTWSSTAIVTTLDELSPVGATSYLLVDNSTTNYLRINRSITVPNDSNTYTISIYIKKTFGETSSRLGFNYGLTGGTAVQQSIRFNSDTGARSAGSVDDVGDWWRLYFTTSNNSTGNTTLYCEFYPSTGFYNSGDDPTATGTATISGIQIEQNSFATPFIDGSRTNTTSLLDSTNTATLTIDSLTYESDNTFRFVQSNNDLIGTDIPVTDYPARTDFSYEVWYKPDAWPAVLAANQYGETRTKGILIGASSYGGSAIYYEGRPNGDGMIIYGFIRANDSYRSTAVYTIPSLNQYYHFAFVNDSVSGTMKLYVNGTLHSSVTGPTDDYNSNATSAGNIGIGKRQVDGGGTWNYRCFPGYLPLAKIYRKALSADEVLQNYTATKWRFQ